MRRLVFFAALAVSSSALAVSTDHTFRLSLIGISPDSVHVAIYDPDGELAGFHYDAAITVEANSYSRAQEFGYNDQGQWSARFSYFVDGDSTVAWDSAVHVLNYADLGGAIRLEGLAGGQSANSIGAALQGILPYGTDIAELKNRTAGTGGYTGVEVAYEYQGELDTLVSRIKTVGVHIDPSYMQDQAESTSSLVQEAGESGGWAGYTAWNAARDDYQVNGTFGQWLGGVSEENPGHIVTELADAVFDEARSGHESAGSFGAYLGDGDPESNVVDDIVTDLGADLGTDHGSGSWEGATADATADAVWDEALSGHTGAGTAGKALSDLEASTGLFVGEGDFTTTLTFKNSSTSDVIPYCRNRLYTDSDRTILHDNASALVDGTRAIQLDEETTYYGSAFVATQYSTTNYSITGDATKDVSVSPITIPASGDPDMCTMYVFALDDEGVGVEGVYVTFAPSSTECQNPTYGGGAISTAGVIDITDGDGKAVAALYKQIEMNPADCRWEVSFRDPTAVHSFDTISNVVIPDSTEAGAIHNQR